MSERYSLYEAKAKLSALVRQVREGRSVVITVHGKPVAELRPVETAVKTLKGRIAELTAKGIITPSKRKPGKRPAFQPGPRKRGALKRFLADRE